MDFTTNIYVYPPFGALNQIPFLADAKFQIDAIYIGFAKAFDSVLTTSFF